MDQESVIKILAGGAMAAKKTSETTKDIRFEKVV